MNFCIAQLAYNFMMLIFPGLVFMGMGDSADNPDEVKKALKILTDVDLFHMGQTKVMVSTGKSYPKKDWRLSLGKIRF